MLWKIKGLPLPPSENHAYENIPLCRTVRFGKVFYNGGGRRLTEEGRSFKTQTENIISRTLALQEEIPKNVRLGLFVRLFLAEVENSSYPKRARSRYKKIDATNHLKLLLDALATAIGVDDSSNFLVVTTKEQDREEHVDIALFTVPDGEDPWETAMRTFPTGRW